MPTRGIIFLPKWEPKEDTTSYLSHIGFWSTVDRGFKSEQDQFGWSIQFGGTVEFVRWGSDASLFAINDMELTADTRNDISFNPRGAFWEEGIMYAQNDSVLDWQVGFIHRCRHDIDNGDPNATIGRFEQRTLIYNSLSERLIFNPVELLGIDIKSWFKAEQYLVREDYRIPNNLSFKFNFNRLAYSIGAGAQFDLYKTPASAIYTRLDGMLSIFGKESGFFSRFHSIEETTFDGRFELGYSVSGPAAKLQLFIGGQYFEDDASTPLPKDNRFFLAGFRVSGIEMTF